MKSGRLPKVLLKGGGPLPGRIILTRNRVGVLVVGSSKNDRIKIDQVSVIGSSYRV